MFNEPRDETVRPPMESSNIAVRIGAGELEAAGDGCFKWPVAFRLASDAKADGWLIQEVLVTTYSYAEKGAEQAGFYEVEDSTEGWTKVDAPEIHYWEAWKITKDDRQINWMAWRKRIVAHDDEYERAPTKDSRGMVKVLGWIKFYVGDLPDAFIFNNKDTNALALPSTTILPNFWGRAGATEHNLTIRWEKSKGACNNSSNQLVKFGP